MEDDAGGVDEALGPRAGVCAGLGEDGCGDGVGGGGWGAGGDGVAGVGEGGADECQDERPGARLG